MTLNALPLWLHTALCIAGFALGVGLHLKWHPLRRHFSDGFDFLRSNPLPMWVIVAAILAHELSADSSASPALGLLHGTYDRMQGDLWDIGKRAIDHAALLIHRAFPPWPIALLLPVWTILLAVNLMRFPYRYQATSLRQEQATSLVLLCVGSMAWAVIGLFRYRHPWKGTPETVWHSAHMFFVSLTTAAFQVWLARLLVRWARPRSVDEGGDLRTAMQDCFSRWQNILWLGAFNAVWLALWSWQESAGGWLPWLLLMEMLFVFSALPVAVAVSEQSFLKAGGLAMRAIWRCCIPLLGFTMTAIIIFSLAEYAVAALSSLATAPKMEKPIRIAATLLLFGVLQSWLLPSAMLMLYRIGFRDTDAAKTETVA